MKRKPFRIGALFLSVIALLIMSISVAFALEPEELTNFDLRNENGQRIIVEYYQPTGKWQAMAEGNETIYTGLAPNSDGMWYCRSGIVDFTYNGFVEFQDDIWYVENGKVNTEYVGEQVVGDEVYTISKGKVVDQDYTTKAKQEMALTVVGAIALIALAILWRRTVRKNRILQREYEEELRRKQEEYERQEKIRRAEETYEDEVEGQGLSYVKEKFLTDREKAFYPYLKSVADNLGYTVSMKARLGDLVTGKHPKYTSEGGKELFKVQRKHVDFVLFDPVLMDVKLIIELDDTTHDRQNRVNRDVFVDNVLEGTGYKILHIYGPENLEKEIRNKLNDVEPEEA